MDEEDAPDGGEGAVPANRVHQREAPEVSKESFITVNPILKEAIKPASGAWKKMEEVSSFSFFGSSASPTEAASPALANSDNGVTDEVAVEEATPPVSTFSFSSAVVANATTSAISATAIKANEVVKIVDRPGFKFVFDAANLISAA